MHKLLQHYTLVLASFLTIVFFASYYSQPTENVDSQSKEDNSILPQVIKPVNLNRPFDFAGETLPMNNFDVRERLDRELLLNTYQHTSTILHLKNMYKYFPMMEKVLAEHGVPDDFKYLAVAESSFRNAISSAGARGVWQFMKLIADHYGLEMNDEVDERYHVEKATEAACKYLKSYKERFGNWTLAAVAYNYGGTRLAKDIREQGTNNYFDLYLNHETSQYLFRIVAIKEVMKNPEAFGFYLTEEDGYKPLSNYRIVEVNGSIPNLAAFAKEQGTTYRMLKVFNPWLISDKLTNSAKKTYQIKIPK
ncbi:MAG: lytic transglycosylase domain-containing protein [Saprospiraceae bacterium]